MVKNIVVVADATDPDPYASFEAAASKASKQMRRYKRKLRDHHERQGDGVDVERIKARDYVLAAVPEQDDTPDDQVQESTGRAIGRCRNDQGNRDNERI